MQLTESEIRIGDLEPPRSRTPGIHFSDLLKRILVKQDPQRFAGGEYDPEFGLAGFIWEETLGAALSRMAVANGERERGRFIQQLEVEFRKVLLTIDTFDTVRWRVLEFKFTESSSSRPITDHHFWHYFVQLKAYCLATGTTEAELWVYFARGNYKEKRREAKRWVVRFSERELEENWLMLENMRKAVERERAA